MARRSSDPDSLFAAARDGDRRALARLVSMVEKGGPEARSVGRLSHARAGTATTVGVTGAPGSGKSTLTSALVGAMRAEVDDGVESVAVLAVDPSSPFTGGALLGDRVRMGEHVGDDRVFIRSMATRGHLGGLTLAVPEAIRLLDAVGVPWVVVETVGVGQVEVEVAGEADTTVVVVNPGWGDAVQASKAGLMEIADVFVVNKADRPGVAETVADLEGMLARRPTGDARGVPVLVTQATTGEGVEALWAALRDHRRWAESTGERERRRRLRAEAELRRILTACVLHQVGELEQNRPYAEALDAVLAHRTDPWTAAEALLATKG